MLLNLALSEDKSHACVPSGLISRQPSQETVANRVLFGACTESRLPFTNFGSSLTNRHPAYFRDVPIASTMSALGLAKADSPFDPVGT
jgi:hypothetical protein